MKPRYVLPDDQVFVHVSLSYIISFYCVVPGNFGFCISCLFYIVIIFSLLAVKYFFFIRYGYVHMPTFPLLTHEFPNWCEKMCICVGFAQRYSDLTCFWLSLLQSPHLRDQHSEELPVHYLRIAVLVPRFFVREKYRPAQVNRGVMRSPGIALVLPTEMKKFKCVAHRLALAQTSPKCISHCAHIPFFFALNNNLNIFP